MGMSDRKEGYDEGYDAGYSVGYEKGLDTGYAAGYNDCQNDRIENWINHEFTILDKVCEKWGLSDDEMDREVQVRLQLTARAAGEGDE